jgi:hypothetical protein
MLYPSCIDTFPCCCLALVLQGEHHDPAVDMQIFGVELIYARVPTSDLRDSEISSTFEFFEYLDKATMMNDGHMKQVATPFNNSSRKA